MPRSSKLRCRWGRNQAWGDPEGVNRTASITSRSTASLLVGFPRSPLVFAVFLHRHHRYPPPRLSHSYASRVLHLQQHPEHAYSHNFFITLCRLCSFFSPAIRSGITLASRNNILVPTIQSCIFRFLARTYIAYTNTVAVASWLAK